MPKNATGWPRNYQAHMKGPARGKIPRRPRANATQARVAAFSKLHPKLVKALRRLLRERGYRGPLNSVFVHCVDTLAALDEERLEQYLELCGFCKGDENVSATTIEDLVDRLVPGHGHGTGNSQLNAAEQIYQDIEKETDGGRKPKDGMFLYPEEVERADGSKISTSTWWAATFATKGNKEVEVFYKKTGETSTILVADPEFPLCVFPFRGAPEEAGSA